VSLGWQRTCESPLPVKFKMVDGPQSFSVYITYVALSHRISQNQIVTQYPNLGVRIKQDLIRGDLLRFAFIGLEW